MRYAVPVKGGKLSEHFGHCSHFALFDVDEARKEIIRRGTVIAPEHQPGLLPAWLAKEGVSVVIASGMGSRAQAIFRDNRIDVIIGVVGNDPEKAVLDHIKGTLAAGDNICDH
jgi:predicted Fe-Mo cluster-binding NifX family protein